MQIPAPSPVIFATQTVWQAWARFALQYMENPAVAKKIIGACSGGSRYTMQLQVNGIIAVTPFTNSTQTGVSLMSISMSDCGKQL